MKKYLFSLCIPVMLCDFAVAQVQSFYVHPSATDNAYTSQDSHLVARHPAVSNGKLLLFAGGTFSKTSQYEFFTLYAAGLGFHAINVAYPNNVLTTLLAGNSDSLSFDKFREEICFGTQVSPMVNVDSFNSIYTRTLKLLNFLHQTYPADGWDAFLLSPGEIDWSKIVVSGHSQGSGHAAYFAKRFAVERVVMFAGPNDYSTYFSKAAPWLRKSGVTPVNKHFAFLHLQDEIVPFHRQYENLGGMGMLQNDDTTLVEDFTHSFANSRCLYSKLAPKTAGQFHNSVIIFSATPNNTDNTPAFDSVWRYMLLSALSTKVLETESREPHFRIYPNPAASTIHLHFDNVRGKKLSLAVYDISGKEVFRQSDFFPGASANEYAFDTGALQRGLYFVVVSENEVQYRAKVQVN